MEAFTNTNDLGMVFFDLAAGAVKVVPLLKNKLRDMGVWVCVVVNNAKTVALSPPGHVPTLEDVALLRGSAPQSLHGEGRWLSMCS